MSLSRLTGGIVGLALLVAGSSELAPAQPHKTAPPKSASASAKSSKGKKRSSRKRPARLRGQQKIDAARTRQIQQALIKSHYLDGEPTGALDARTQEALRQFQKDQGWQTKVVPDSRALIKLGLGPSRDRLLNPESAMTTHPAESSVAPKETSGTPQK